MDSEAARLGLGRMPDGFPSIGGWDRAGAAAAQAYVIERLSLSPPHSVVKLKC